MKRASIISHALKTDETYTEPVFLFHRIRCGLLLQRTARTLTGGGGHLTGSHVQQTRLAMLYARPRQGHPTRPPTAQNSTTAGSKYPVIVEF